MERDCVSWLRQMARLYLAVSFVGAAFIGWGWSMVDVKKYPEYQTLGSPAVLRDAVETRVNYPGIGLAITLAIQGAAACALMFCIAAIAEDTGIMTADKRTISTPREWPGVVGISFGDSQSNLITYVLPGSPADKAGITAGYNVVAVGHKTVINGTGAHWLLGGEVGTAVEVEICKDGNSTKHTLIRAERPTLTPGHEV